MTIDHHLLQCPFYMQLVVTYVRSQNYPIDLIFVDSSLIELSIFNPKLNSLLTSFF